ncbi:hypothetical protein C8F01DRAFT_1082701 [Mycena amicta]|nr:hypothetical protein C8F01DRAFT_1082701 [Mycena amicta]
MAELDGPNLPRELERPIFELAAWNDRKTIQSLIFVARRVHIWIEPLLHRVTLLSTDTAVHRFQAFLDRRPADAQTYTQHLAIRESSLQRDLITHILSVCTNITDFAFWTGATYPELLDAMQPLTCLKRVSINLFTLLLHHPHVDCQSFELRSPAVLAPFRMVSHMQVLGAIPERMVPVFSMLPSLTHLAFTGDAGATAVSNVLTTCGNLTLLVVVYADDARHKRWFGALSHPAGPGEALWHVLDPRFCVDSVGLNSCLEDSWELGTWGGRDFWCRAEEIVAARSQAQERTRLQS